MASPNQRLVQPATKSEADLGISFDGLISQAALSTALVSVFRGKFCDAILPNRKATTFNKEQVIYEVGDQERTFFFLQDGFVKVGTVTSLSVKNRLDEVKFRCFPVKRTLRRQEC